MAATTCRKSVIEAFCFNEQVDDPLEADAVEDADTVSGTLEDVVGDDVVVFRGDKFDDKTGVGASTVFAIDEGVVRCGF